MGSDHSKISRENRRFKPSAPSASPAPTCCQQSKTCAPSSAPQVTTVHESVSAPQNTTVHAPLAAPRAATVHASVAAPQNTAVHAQLAAPWAATVHASMAAPKNATVHAPLAAPRSAIIRAPVTTSQKATIHAPPLAKPRRTSVSASLTAPRAASVHASVAAPQKAAVRASGAALSEIKFTSSKRCQICKKQYEENIFQCKNGHGACEVCYSLDLSCKLCLGVVKFTDTRNFDTRQIKCPNAAEGCTLFVQKSELTKHEQECLFKKLKCPALGNCNWRGKISQLSMHFDEYHPSSRQANINTELILQNIYKEYNSLQLIKLGTYNFLFYVKVSESERKVYMDLQLIGSKLSASKWYYEIHVFNKREPSRKHKCVHSCRSSIESQGISLIGCAVMPLPYAMTFANDVNLTYKIFIKKSFKGF